MVPAFTFEWDGGRSQQPGEPKDRFGRPGNSGPAGFALPMPKASAPKLHQRNGARLENAVGERKEAPRPQWVAEGPRADFFGASSVASALGIRRGRDPTADRR